MTRPFDPVIRLRAVGNDQPHTRAGTTSTGRTSTRTTSAAYRHLIGFYGGITTAVLLPAIPSYPARLGDTMLLTVNDASSVVAGGPPTPPPRRCA